MFQNTDAAMGRGIVGGSVLSIEGGFVTVGEQLARLLNGADPKSLPTLKVKNSLLWIGGN